MRYLYSFLFYLAMPIVILRLMWRSRRQPAYRQRLLERFGFYPKALQKCIWVHAVSVGEVLAAIPLIKAIKTTYPAHAVLVTTMTPTGAARVQAVFGESVMHAYIPYDLPDTMHRFLQTMHPEICIIMETELWPNLIAACQQQHIPICLVNARLSAKSAQGYARIAPLTRQMLQHINIIAAHGQADADRFVALGAAKERIIVTGNIKFDVELPHAFLEKSKELRAELGVDRFVWIAASTHEGEEEIVLAVHKKLCAVNSQALLILVPRHPDRFDAIAKLSAQTFVTKRRSAKQACTPDTEVYLGDTMGELLLLYGGADVAFVGGSLIERGGHNILEPGALGKPILSGPSLYNFAEISDQFVSAQALLKVQDVDSLAQALLRLQDNAAREQMGQRALSVMDANRGALGKQLAVIASYL